MPCPGDQPAHRLPGVGDGAVEQGHQQPAMGRAGAVAEMTLDLDFAAGLAVTPVQAADAAVAEEGRAVTIFVYRNVCRHGSDLERKAGVIFRHERLAGA